MVKLRKLVRICDDCDEEKVAHYRCDVCGKDLCDNCFDKDDPLEAFLNPSGWGKRHIFKMVVCCECENILFRKQKVFDADFKKKMKKQFLENFQSKITAHKL
jgi:hypothetical protein